MQTDSWPIVLKMKLPPIHVNGPNTNIEIRDRAEVKSFGAWNAFSKAVMNDEEVKFKIISHDVTVEVKGPLSFLGLSYNGLSFEKTLVVKG
jgi:hypothetical protein